MSQVEELEIELVQGEDFSAQIYWTDEDGNAMPCTTPGRLEVRDMYGAMLLQFASENAGSVATKAALVITGSDGIMQISAPRSVTTPLVPGRYLFDLFAVANNGVSPFTTQEVQVCSGWFIVSTRVTKMEVAPV